MKFDFTLYKPACSSDNAYVRHLTSGQRAKFTIYFALIPILLAFLPWLVFNQSRAPFIGYALLSTFYSFAALKYFSRPVESATQSPSDYQDKFDHIKNAAAITGMLGPEADIVETKQALANACGLAMKTELASLFTIDPCMGSVECCSTDAVTEELQQAMLRVLGMRLTDRTQTQAWIASDMSKIDTQDTEALHVLIENGVQAIIACPIRSEVSVCGALVAFYKEQPTDFKDRALDIEIIVAHASAVLSYALSLEQSRFLLDDLAGANQELSLQATVDGLTGLTNHRTFQQTLNETCCKSERKNGRPFCVVMVDVDHFKVFNDTHGHREGDAVLRKVGKTMMEGLRQGDLAARYGGEEFAMIFQGVTKDDALAAADRIRRSIAQQALSKSTVTVSMGISEFPIDATTPGELIECADKALYHAKLTGRNRVFAWGAMSSDSKNSIRNEDVRKKSVLVLEQASNPSADICKDVLLEHSFAVDLTNTFADAIEVLKIKTFDILLVSLDALPDRDIKWLGTLAAMHPHMPRVLMAMDLPPKDCRDALRRGACDILLKPFNPAELPVAVERNLERQRLELQRLMEKSTNVMLQAIEALVAAVDAKDHFTAGHSQRVTAITTAIGDLLKLSHEELYALELASKLHDIGKIALPDSALNKQSPLTEDEWQAMRQHPVQGARIVGEISELGYVSTIIRHHHERLDGSGYPDGLIGPAIPYMSRIIAVADAFEAMTSERAYRDRLSPSEALNELRHYSNTHYQPEIIDVLEQYLASNDEIASDDNEKMAA